MITVRGGSVLAELESYMGQGETGASMQEIRDEKRKGYMKKREAGAVRSGVQLAWTR